MVFSAAGCLATETPEGGTVKVKSQSRDDEVELLLTGSVRNRKCY